MGVEWSPRRSRGILSNLFAGASGPQAIDDRAVGISSNYFATFIELDRARGLSG